MSLREHLDRRGAVKSWDIEEGLDARFFRPLAIVFTAGFHRIGATPNQVSVLGLLVGASAAPFVLEPAPAAAVLAVLLLWIAEILDAVDGQLARLGGTSSAHGRVVDGLCSSLMHIVLYAAIATDLALRPEPSIWIPRWSWFPLAAAAAVSHSLQSGMYDFYRCEYVRIVRDRVATDPDLEEAREDPHPLAKIFRGYAQRQARTASVYQPLLRRMEARFRARPVPAEFARRYAELQGPLVRRWNLLGPNSHLIVLSAALLLRRPEAYLWADLLVFNAAALVLTGVQRGVTGALLQELRKEPLARAFPETAPAGAS